MKKRATFGLLGLAAAGAGAAGSWTALGNYLYNQSSTAQRRPLDDTQDEGRLWARRKVGFREATIQAADGLILWAAFAPVFPNHHRWVICMHGYGSSHEAMGSIGLRYHQEGWHVLMPDQRAHGQSEGDYVGWGYAERLDLIGWINWILRRDQRAEIQLHGVSMGAATILMATGGALSHQVKAAISDCSYTTIEAELRHVLGRSKQDFAVPTIPIGLLFAALRRATQRRSGFDLRDASPIRAVTQSKTPTLFIHGVDDDFVPSSMMGKLYQAASCPKSFLWMPGVRHASAVDTDPALYWTAVSTFLQDFIKNPL